MGKYFFNVTDKEFEQKLFYQFLKFTSVQQNYYIMLDAFNFNCFIEML